MTGTTSSAASADKWIVCSTFSSTGQRVAYLHEQLNEYRFLGFQVVVVDTSPTLTDERRADWDRLAARWMQRPNIGYDFASYKAGCELIVREIEVPLESLHLILTNDSCFGPYFPLANVLSRFKGTPADRKPVFGITDSFETGQHHLQSYWLYFPPSAVVDAIDFLDRMPLPSDRDAAILHGELALSQHMKRNGHELVPYTSVQALVERCAQRPLGRAASLLEFSMRRVLKRYRHTRRGDSTCIKFLISRPQAFDNVNPTLDFGRFMFRAACSPFIKVSLVRDNPEGDPMLPAQTDVKGMTNAEAAAMLRNDRRVGRR